MISYTYAVRLLLRGLAVRLLLRGLAVRLLLRDLAVHFLLRGLGVRFLLRGLGVRFSIWMGWGCLWLIRAGGSRRVDVPRELGDHPTPTDGGLVSRATPTPAGGPKKPPIPSLR